MLDSDNAAVAKTWPDSRLKYPAQQAIGALQSKYQQQAHSKVGHFLILNDIEARRSPGAPVAQEIINVGRAYPTAKIILTSYLAQSPEAVDENLILLGLKKAEFIELMLQRSLPFRGSKFPDQLFKASAGHPLTATMMLDLLSEERVTPKELIELLSNFESPGVVDSAGTELSLSTPEHKRIITDISSVSDEFLRKLRDNPRLLYDLSPRGFEELAAELLTRLGYIVDLTPPTKDGGKDIYAAKKDHLGTFLYVVECKKYAADRPIGVGLVRQLHGVVQAEKATGGILATTSFFTKGAKEFQTAIEYQMSLKDYCGIQGWLKDALRRKKGL